MSGVSHSQAWSSQRSIWANSFRGAEGGIHIKSEPGRCEEQTGDTTALSELARGEHLLQL